MAIKITHCGTTYSCATAVKCTNDKYIKLFDENGVEMVSFDDISDFDEYKISGGSFTDPTTCANPIKLTSYVIGGRTILPSDWVESRGVYEYVIENELFSKNKTTCDIFISFADDKYEFDYYATQENGKITLITTQVPEHEIMIASIMISKV